MSQEPQIRVLSVNVANKIAAGEVVDRPASVLKELLENALDAGAGRIDVEIVSGGRKLVSVSDDGRGMVRDDAILSIERQATSKIKDVDDIEHITTLGFRGEALAAIASVSRFRLVTCVKGVGVGTEIRVTGGKVSGVEDAGCPPGTTVEVRDLFFNVPARRKFLRSYQTEQAHTRACFITQALAHPQTGFGLKIDNRVVYQLAGGGTLEERARELFGADYLARMVPVDFTRGEIAISGYAGLPSLNRSDTAEQYVFVNGRAASAPLIGYAIKEGYHTLLPDRKRPCVFLFINLPADLVDVNVHPTKKEIRFRRPGDARDAIIGALKEALGVTQRTEDRGQKTEGPVFPGGEAAPAIHRQLIIPDLPELPVISSPPEPQTPNPAEPRASTPEAPWRLCRIVGQVGGLYVLLETDEGYVVMDPHAAHERVLFEKFMADVLSGQVESQGLLMPDTVEMNPDDARKVRDNLPLFNDMGFGISEFGGDAFVVDALPSCFAGTSANALLADIAHSLDTAGKRGGTARWREETVAQAACKAAVKARDRLKTSEMEQLVLDLAHCELPYTCPHGRPTMIFTPFKELHRKFGRE